LLFHVEQQWLPGPFHVKREPATLAPGGTDPRETARVQMSSTTTQCRKDPR